MKKINMQRLKVGDTLAEAICSDYAYNVLLSEGTVIRQEHIDKLHALQAKGISFVMGSPCDVSAISLDVLNKISDEQVRRAYLNTFMVGKSLFESIQVESAVNIELVFESVDLLVEQMLCNDTLLLQLAAVRIIDDYTFSHIVNAALYTAAFGRCLNKSPQEIRDLCLAGLLHDMGKAKISPDILRKPGELTPAEFAEIKKHPQYGYDELSKVRDINERVRQAALQHHERGDGTGYPRGLQGKEISLFARIIAIVDIYDALTSDRCYRGRILPHESVEVLMADCATDRLDAELVRTFLKHIALYPIGTDVTLSDGRIGRVTDIHPEIPLRPIIQICEQEENCTQVDLLEHPTLFISRVLS